MKEIKSPYVAIKINGKKKDLHRHLMEEFLGRPLLRNEVVHHINEDKHDNRIENLQIMSFKEHNLLHGHTKRLDGYHPPSPKNKLYGTKCPQSKLNDELVKSLLKEFEFNRTGLRKRSRELGICHSTLSSILNRKSWKHISI